MSATELKYSAILSMSVVMKYNPKLGLVNKKKYSILLDDLVYRFWRTGDSEFIKGVVLLIYTSS